ncbi:DUF262 domain-containing protein [Treponema zioleckii]|uniref:DUF262 domain-containing protein n=1 Tax=Treponema zioleckii TaxID=331680 RepID=UPI00168AAC61|nr:DUF262 domain-containing protein [Treponema zioleckii]
MAQNIEPYRQTVQACLKDKTYYIDFYQREYVWSMETVKVLLEDIYEVFEQSYLPVKDAEMTSEVMEKFNWYYMNVFITNKINNKTYIVDGQQRLSTLTLIAIKLYKMAKKQFHKNLLRSCICGQDYFEGDIYCIDNYKRKKAMDSILNETEFELPYQNQTEQTLIERYNDISAYIDKKTMDEKELEAFIYYFLNKLVLVELSIDNQDDTAMVFEVINDRGEALRPFEILKGKLIGALPKSDTDNYSEMWDASLHRINGIEDQFFINYLKSRFIFKRNSDKENLINNAYHRYIFDDKEDSKTLGFRKTDANRIFSIKKFIEEDLVYYSRLYAKITENKDEFLKYSNEIHKLDGQYQLILSACKINDSEEDEKIHLIAKEYDRLHMLLRMNGVYDSNDFHSISYSLNEKLKNLPITDYRTVFNTAIIARINEATNTTNTSSVLDYTRFSQIGYGKNIDQTALYYLLARVENFICSKINQTAEHDVYYMSIKHSNVNGYHIEHIFSDNDENRGYFSSEEEFWNERNGIGALLLLKGRMNISSGNESYREKLKTYSNGTIWAKTLCNTWYHTNPDFTDFNKWLKATTNKEFIPYDSFTIQSMKERSQLLYKLVKIIWEVDSKGASE